MGFVVTASLQAKHREFGHVAIHGEVMNAMQVVLLLSFFVHRREIRTVNIGSRVCCDVTYLGNLQMRFRSSLQEL